MRIESNLCLRQSGPAGCRGDNIGEVRSGDSNLKGRSDEAPIQDLDSQLHALFGVVAEGAVALALTALVALAVDLDLRLLVVRTDFD